MRVCFVKIGNTYINLDRVRVVRDYPESHEALVVFGDPQASEVFGGAQRRRLIEAMETRAFAAEETGAVNP